MKKLLLIPFMLLGICQLEAQIIITGVMYDPKGPDAPAQGSTYTAPSTTEPAKDSEGNIYIYKGGYEYVQFMATENIDFSTTNYSVVVCRQPGGTTPSVDNGWASGGNRTFKFNLTSGTVTKGSYFYVGGPEKRLGGFTYETNSGVTTAYPTLDISASNWIRTIAYSGVSGTDAGDGFGASTTALIANSGNPSGVAVFAGTSVTEASVPLDAIFITSANPASSGSIGTVYVPENGSIPAKGYRVPNNDRYSQTNGADAQPFFGMGTNTYGFVYQQYTPFSLPTDQANFLMLGGKYNETTQTWDTPRAASYVTLVPTADEEGANFGTLDMTEGTGATTLPVSLVSFTAKNQTSGVVLNWVTASEQNNKQFTLLRSMDGKQFTAIGSVFGNGTTQNTSNYNFIDANP
ncbi:MAG TPA: hypothetical protein VFM79_13745, partial [Pelobium sp.]|nr:hypothetical protein [Pelobium sp.]